MPQPRDADLRKAPTVDTNISTVGLRWHLLRTHHHCEVRADANLIESGIESFLPLLHTRRRRQICSEPLFPQYLFARFDFATSSRLVAFTRGIQGFVRLGGEPAIVEGEVIALLRRRCQDLAASMERPLERGEQVLIDAGPFQSLCAVVQGRVPARDRVQVLLTTVGHAYQVEVPAEWVLRATA
jgi:transcriptional antiterminator RfaH